MLTIENAIIKIYDASPTVHMNMVRNIKEREPWCKKHIQNFEVIKAAFERVLNMRYTERIEVYRYYYGLTSHKFANDCEFEMCQIRKKKSMKKLELTHIGRDSWDRPVYICEGEFYVDVDSIKKRAPNICTKNNNDFNGEPLWPIAEGLEIEFIPQRDTWD